MTSGLPLGEKSIADRIERILSPDEPVPAVAWPTIGLFVGGLGLWLGSSALYVAGVWPWPISTVLNWFAAFLLFTVAHEASCVQTDGIFGVSDRLRWRREQRKIGLGTVEHRAELIRRQIARAWHERKFGIDLPDQFE